MKYLRAIIVYLLFSILSTQISTYALEETISVSAIVPRAIAPVYPPYVEPSSTTTVEGVPLTRDAAVDTVIFKGISYPGSVLSLLKNGVLVAQVPASPNGRFEIRLRNLNPSTYTFSIRAEDESGLTSKLESFTIFISEGVTTLIEGIFIAPTITTDKQEVAWGDRITIMGKSAPNTTVNILVNSETKLLKKTTSDEYGTWLYSLDSSELEIGDHTTKARSIREEGISSLSNEIEFKVGSRNETRRLRSTVTDVNVICDINNDSRVNLRDFSIMAFWYKRDGFPERIDLNKDTKLDLIDFSILAFCWTG